MAEKLKLIVSFFLCSPSSKLLHLVYYVCIIQICNIAYYQAAMNSQKLNEFGCVSRPLHDVLLCIPATKKQSRRNLRLSYSNHFVVPAVINP